MARGKASCGAGEHKKFPYPGKSSRSKRKLLPSFTLTPFLLDEQGSFVKYIQQETGTRVQIKGIGSGFIDQETGQEHPEPLYIHIT